MNEPPTRAQLEHLSQVIGYGFNDSSRLLSALTHRSFGADNNERLEFLGDSILNFLAAEVLFDTFPDADEGTLTRWRASLVRRETLACFSRSFELGAYLRLGSGELKSGGRHRDSILADAFEALLGALYLDGGLDAGRSFLVPLLEERIRGGALAAKDPKTRLQEALQAVGLPLPVYEVLRVDGQPHNQQFTVSCQVAGEASSFTARGSSRRRAEQAAAEMALRDLNWPPKPGTQAPS